MGRTRDKTGRGARGRQWPGLESLEGRRLLSQGGAAPAPASGAFLKGDGTVDFDGIIGASAARLRFGVDGSGQSVAVIDTGVDYRNPMLGGAQGPKVIEGADFTGSPNGILPTWQHGTGVAGLVASPSLGVAPGASIVPLRVFGDNNQGSFDNIATALEWVAQHHSETNITAVNLSVSDGGNYLSDLFTRDGGVGQRITHDVQSLDDLDIPVVIASGNNFDGKSQGQGFASIIPEAISVTATDESDGHATDSTDRLASNAQRLGKAKGGIYATKIAAPGVGIVAPSGEKGTATEDGTSFAAPQVTGTIVLLQQMYQAAYHRLPSVATLTQLLQDGADVIHDGVTGIKIGRLDTLRSLTLLDRQIHPPGSKAEAPTAPEIVAQALAPPTPIIVAQTLAPPAVTPPPAATPPVDVKAATDAGASVVSGTTSVAATVATETKPVDSGTKDAPRPPKQPVAMTEVFLNGTSIGSYPTSQLARKYAAILNFSGGSARSLRIWAPQESTIDLGVSIPSGAVARNHASDARVKQAAGVDHVAHFQPKKAPVSLRHHAAPKKHRGLFGIPFLS